MRNATAILLFVSMILCLNTNAIVAEDANSIVAKHLEAKGGVENLKAVKTLTKIGKVNANGMTGNIELYQRAPLQRFLRLQIMGLTVREGCDGEHIWSVTPNGFKLFEGEEREKRLDQSRIEPLIGYKERGGEFEYVGEDSVKGVMCHKLLFIEPTGDSVYAFIAKDSYQMLKSMVPTPQGNMEQYWDNFREVDGVVFPFLMWSSSPTGSMKFEFTEIQVNTELSDTLFIMPDSTKIKPRMIPLPDSLRGKGSAQPRGK